MKHWFVGVIMVFAVHVFAAPGPNANNDSAVVNENGQVNIAVTANDVDPTGGNLTITIALPPTNGTATVNGTSVLYKPQLNFFGADSFSYAVCDTFNLCATAEVYVNVKGTNLAPLVTNDSYTFSDTSGNQVLPVLANDTDPANDTLYISSVIALDTTNTLGTLSVDSGRQTLTFAHNPSTCGTAVFDYIVCNLSKCDTGVVTINITCPDSIFLPQGFSPNGDGKNDLLVFRGLEYFSPSSLNVFNRYGTTVYVNTSYLNDWDGTDMDSHHALPDGTYFYVLKLPSGHTYNNYIIINR